MLRVSEEEGATISAQDNLFHVWNKDEIREVREAIKEDLGGEESVPENVVFEMLYGYP